MSPADCVTAIIVTHNRAERLRRSIRSVMRQRPTPPSLVVVDNGCTDHTSTVLQEECPAATVVRVPQNLGCVVGSNIGAAAASHEVLFFLDDDSELADDAVATAARVLLSNDRIGAVIGTIIEDGRPIRATKTPSLTFINVCHSQGAFRRSAFVATGMYPHDFFYGAEEMDLSLRLLAAGYDIVFQPDIVLVHASEEQSRQPFGEVEVHRNMLRVVLMRAPYILLFPWALKKVYDLTVAVLRTRRASVLASELSRLPLTILRSLGRRRALSWKVFAAWRYLGTREVTDPDYRSAALVAYPNRVGLLFDYCPKLPFAVR